MRASLDSSRPIMAPSVVRLLPHPLFPCSSLSSPPATTAPADPSPPPPQLSPNRTSQRYSTYTVTPSLHSISSDTVQAEIADIKAGLAKLENKHLASQRFVPSEEKSENLSKLALGAKLERALDRRMGGQDAVMRKKESVQMSEKTGLVA